jgi:hypothetical protein
MPGTYPNYTPNTQSTANDIPGRLDIANGQDYNDHDNEILVHQAYLKSHDGSLLILNSMVNQSVIITASPTFFGLNLDHFTNFPTTPVADPTADYQIVNKHYVDNLAFGGAASGWSGYSGYSGYSGHDGSRGVDGSSGYSGFSGVSGSAGSEGTSGYSGFSGQVGPAGTSGYSGYSGMAGLDGYDGVPMNWRGSYVGSTLYRFNDCVLYSGSCYVMLQPWSIGNNPVDTYYWALISSSGTSGYSGYSGYSGDNPGTPGSSGTSGYSGWSGSPGGDTGPRGISGYSGWSGYSGDNKGTSGYSGYSGYPGIDGRPGRSGFSGYSGGSGTSGYSGPSGGPKGDSGYSGYSGASGLSGYSGPSGGPQGISGYSGWSGKSGYSGDNPGTSGYSGWSGKSGYSGWSGVGTSGYSGFSGEAGPQGVSGTSGWSGTAGASGISGYSGSGSSLTVREIDGTPSVSNVNTIEFDEDSGFHVTDQGNGVVSIDLGSYFEDIVVSGQDTLVPVGVENIELIAGVGVSITTNKNSTPKSVTFNASTDPSVLDRILTSNYDVLVGDDGLVLWE